MLFNGKVIVCSVEQEDSFVSAMVMCSNFKYFWKIKIPYSEGTKIKKMQAIGLTGSCKIEGDFIVFDNSLKIDYMSEKKFPSITFEETDLVESFFVQNDFFLVMVNGIKLYFKKEFEIQKGDSILKYVKEINLLQRLYIEEGLKKSEFISYMY